MMFRPCLRHPKTLSFMSKVAKRTISSKPPSSSPSSGANDEQQSASTPQTSIVEANDIQESAANKPRKYIAFKDFPKPAVDISKLGTNKLHFVPNDTETASIQNLCVDGDSVSQPWFFKKEEAKDNLQQRLEEVDNKTYHDFRIPKKYVASEQLSEVDRLIHEINDLSSMILDDGELSRPPYIDHPLKRTWSGLMPLNDGFHKLSNEYLWEIMPEDKLFNASPFGKIEKPKDSIKMYETWESEKRKEEKQLLLQKIKEEEEAKEPLKEFENKTSFYTQSGGRKKLNRNLVKKYKKLREDGLLGNENKDKK